MKALYIDLVRLPFSDIILTMSVSFVILGLIGIISIVIADIVLGKLNLKG